MEKVKEERFLGTLSELGCHIRKKEQELLALLEFLETDTRISEGYKKYLRERLYTVQQILSLQYFQKPYQRVYEMYNMTVFLIILKEDRAELLKSIDELEKRKAVVEQELERLLEGIDLTQRREILSSRATEAAQYLEFFRHIYEISEKERESDAIHKLMGAICRPMNFWKKIA